MKSEEIKRAVIYCRVSTKEQVDDGNSLVMQERICREYAVKNGYEIAEVFIEQGESAKSADRTQLQILLKYCAIKKHGISAVIAYKLDRVSRNTDDYSQIRIVLKRYGIEIKSTSEYFENTPAGRFMENIIANVAQFDNDVRAERCTGGMKEAVREGRYVWKAPVGYDNVKINGKSTIAPNENAPLVRKVFELIASGLYSTEAVRIMMAEHGLVGKKMSPINHSYFYRMIRNRLYTGDIVMFGERSRGTFEPIITEQLFEKVQRVVTGRKNKITHYLHENPDFPLRRFVVDELGNNLTGYWSKGEYKKFPYYTFKQPGTLIRKEVLETKFLDFLALFEFNTNNLKNLHKGLVAAFAKKEVKNQNNYVQIEATLEAKNKELDHYVTLDRTGDISKATFKDRVAKLEAEIAGLNDHLATRPKISYDIKDLMHFAEKMLKNPRQLWKNSHFELQKRLQKFYFPLGIIFNGQHFRTSEMCSLFRLKSIFWDYIVPTVGSRDEKTNTISRRSFEEDQKLLNSEAFWMSIVEELSELQKILSE